MARGASTAINLITPLIIIAFLACLAVAGLLGVTSAMASMPGSEAACNITKFEPVKGTPDEFLLHTDGCMDSNVTEKIFKVTMEGEVKKSFTELGFYNGQAAKGATYNLQYVGMNVPTLHMTPTVTGITKSLMPF